MRIDRRFLYAGMFLMVIGAVLVAADLGAADTTLLTGVTRLWPLALIAIGVGIVLRRSQLGLPGGMLAAAMPGLVLGGALAMVPGVDVDCGVQDPPASVATQEGAFSGPATVSVTTGCGSIDVRTAPGNAWQLAAGNTAGRLATVDFTARSLEITPVDGDGAPFLDGGRDTWDLTLPTSEIERFSLVTHYGEGQVALTGARIGTLALTANASEIVVDASGATVADLSGTVNVGSLSIQLPSDSDLTGSLRVGGGELQLCAPPDLGLRVSTSGFAEELIVEGVRHDSPSWESPGYASAPRQADLRVSVSFGTVHIDPIGGCK